MVSVRAAWTLGACALLAWGCSSPYLPPAGTLPQPTARPVGARYTGTLHVREWGKGKPSSLVLVHGLGNRGSADFDPIVPALAEHFHVVSFDLPGFGKSPAANHDFTPEGYAQVLEDVVRTYTTPPADVLGHSLGGAVSLFFAGTRPDLVRRLILVSVAGILHRNALAPRQLAAPFRERSGLLGHAAATLVNTTLTVTDRVDPDSAMAERLARGDSTTGAAVALIKTDFGPALEGIVAPTLLIWGDRDSVAPLRTAHLLDSSIRSSRLAVLAGVGHVPMEERPTEVVELTLTQLANARLPLKDTPQPKSPSPVVTCEDETDRVITGRLRRVELQGCQRVQLRDATLERLIAVDSEVSLVNVSIHAARGAALSSSGSTVVATGGSITGEVGMEIDESRLDLAGVTIRATRHPILVREPSHALFSVCSVQGPLGRMHVHGEVELAAE